MAQTKNKKDISKKTITTKSNTETKTIQPIKMKIIKKENKSQLSDIWGFIIWIVGLLVSLSVGFGMVNNTLTIPLIPKVITIISGWIVIILTLLGVLLKLVDAISN